MTASRLRQTLTADALLWTACAVVVLVAHGGIAAALVNWQQTADPSGAATAIMVELAPVSSESAATQTDLPVAPPEKVEPDPQEQPPEKEQPKAEEKIVEPAQVAEPPPDPTPPQKAEITLPQQPTPVQQTPPPKKARVATAAERAEKVAPRQKALNVGVASNNPNSMRTYAVSVIRPHILRFYNFPESARAKGDHGVVVVSFSITRNGHLISRRIAKSSGHSELDSEALATLQRAQPYPPPPPDLTDQQFTFSLPMNYNIR